MAIPLAYAFLATFIDKYGNGQWASNNGELDNAKDAFKNSEYNKGLGILIGLAKNNNKMPNNVAHFVERLKKAFVETPNNNAHFWEWLFGTKWFKDEDDHVIVEGLLTCDGPGVMLIKLASRYNATTLQMETNVFQHIQESIEFDMRGTIHLVVDHATVTCGEAKSSLADLKRAKEQVCKRTHFLKTVVSTVFPLKFNTFIEIGHIFVPKDSIGGRTQIPDDSINEISIYIHYV